jgi:outer membrane protein assembly factor BamB
MNVFLKIYVIFFIFFAPCFYLHAQDISPEDRASGTDDTALDDEIRDYGESYFPDYRIEVFHEAAESEEAILPFVYNGYLYTFSLEQKLPLWRIFIGGDLANPFTTKDRNLYIYDVFNRVYSIDFVKRKIEWRVDINNEIKGKLWVYRNFVLASTNKGRIYVINSEDGKIMHEYNGNEEINASFKVYENLMIVPYKNGKIVAYNIDTRETEWEFYSNGIINVAPVIRDGLLFFGAWDRTFYSLDVLSGKPVWNSYVGENISRDVIIFDNEIILFFSRGEVMCLRKDDGEIEWVKQFENVDFNYNYFPGLDKFFIFIPEFIALNPRDGQVIFKYRERAHYYYKEMLFDNMVEGERLLSDNDKLRYLTEVYFTVSSYPVLPPRENGSNLIYFVTDNSFFYVYDVNKDFYLLKYKLN